MIHQLIVPQAGESVTEAYIGSWRVTDGQMVKKGDVLVDLESQKASFEIEALANGKIKILVSEKGATVKVGEVLAQIDDSHSSFAQVNITSVPVQTKPTSPSVRKLLTESEKSIEQVSGSGKNGRILLTDVTAGSASETSTTAKNSSTQEGSKLPIDQERGDKVTKASRLRRHIATQLVKSKQTTAMLTTFNEVDMSAVINYRAKNKDEFKSKHGVGLGIVSFFALATAKALLEFPLVNAYFDGENIIEHPYVDLSVAVSTEKGLVVPVLRDIHKLDLLGFEQQLKIISEKAKAQKLSIPEMTGGTFTITNGGVFGSMLSTPILNLPQTAILGLHKTQEQAVVVAKQIVIRPMMYVALSYDHRLIDGKDAVSFLVRVKESIENWPN